MDKTLPRSAACETLIRQLIRAGTGVAGNYRSACRARSHAEFTARLGVVLGEADESELWLDVCHLKSLGDQNQNGPLLAESQELAIFRKPASPPGTTNERAVRDFPLYSSGLIFFPFCHPSCNSAILQFCHPAIAKIEGCRATRKLSDSGPSSARSSDRAPRASRLTTSPPSARLRLARSAATSRRSKKPGSRSTTTNRETTGRRGGFSTGRRSTASPQASRCLNCVRCTSAGRLSSRWPARRSRATSKPHSRSSPRR
jgi:four helix bundle protein